MKKEPHVARGECGDCADFLVAQATLKLEADDFTLIAGEGLEELEDTADCLAVIVLLVEVVHDGHLDMCERRGSGCLLAGVERQVPAYRKQPPGEMSLNSRWILSTEPEEGLLHNVSRHLRVAEQPLRVSDQWPLVAVERVNHQFGV